MISRRIFLKDGGLALVSLGFAPQFLARAVAEAAPRRKVLVTIFQRGAVDGLNMIVPFGERGYCAPFSGEYLDGSASFSILTASNASRPVRFSTLVAAAAYSASNDACTMSVACPARIPN